MLCSLFGFCSRPGAGFGKTLGVTRRQLTDGQWKFFESYLPVGGFGPYPARLREQFEG